MPAFNFQERFADAVANGTKRQTIRKRRKDGRANAKPGQRITLYTGMRTRACRKLGEGTCTRVRLIKINVYGEVCIGRTREPRTVDDLAIADGFANRFAMLDWILDTHGLPFEGSIIEWELME